MDNDLCQEFIDVYEDNKTNSWCFTLIYHTEKERENNEIARVKQKASQVQETIVIVNAYGFFFYYWLLS